MIPRYGSNAREMPMAQVPFDLFILVILPNAADPIIPLRFREQVCVGLGCLGDGGKMEDADPSPVVDHSRRYGRPDVVGSDQSGGKRQRLRGGTIDRALRPSMHRNAADERRSGSQDCLKWQIGLVEPALPAHSAAFRLDAIGRSCDTSLRGDW